MRVYDLIKRCPGVGKVSGFNKTKGFYKFFFLMAGFFSLLWFLIRVIPKPSRASYPCMKATMPLAYAFLAYIVSLAGSVLFFKKVYSQIRERRFKYAFISLLIAGFYSSWALIHNASNADATNNMGPTEKFTDPLGPNNPIGEAKGMFPGRVIWVYNSEATNENCTNSSHADAYWLDANCNQDTVDKMLSDALLEITGKDNLPDAWDAIFRFYNTNHGKPDTGYIDSETIFLKINAVSAWSGAGSDGYMPTNIGIEFDTSPQTILAMLRQLINEAGVPQENIFVGDPMCDIWNTIYEKCHDEFPDVNYTSQGNVTGRYKLTPDDQPGIIYSDSGSVMTEITSHTFFQEMMDADYMVNIPSMKGHCWGGVTMFAKNYFGCNTTDHSWELHKGLMKPDNDPLREGYQLYRVFVDLMSDKDLGGKSLIYFMDALWSTSYEHQKPEKFTTAPFNDDWCSSILLSLDPVAIESVGLDIMQKEFTTARPTSNPPRFTYVQWNGVDDYLHQAASSDWWPEDFVYDPDATGTPIGSLGVHEHWNNVDDMQYTRNLATGDGIELVKIFRNIHDPYVVTESPSVINQLTAYPNPCSDKAIVAYTLLKTDNMILEVYSHGGRKVYSKKLDNSNSLHGELVINTEEWERGIYHCVLRPENQSVRTSASIKLVVE